MLLVLLFRWDDLTWKATQNILFFFKLQLKQLGTEQDRKSNLLASKQTVVWQLSVPYSDSKNQRTQPGIFQNLYLVSKWHLWSFTASLAMHPTTLKYFVREQTLQADVWG